MIAQQSVGSNVASVSVRPTKLFIGGITRNTTTKQLRDHFERFGRVLDCVAMRQPDGRPRGFGYVTLDSPKAADACLATPQVVDGRVVDLKRAVPESDMDNCPTTRLHTPKHANSANQSPSMMFANQQSAMAGFHGAWQNYMPAVPGGIPADFCMNPFLTGMVAPPAQLLSPAGYPSPMTSPYGSLGLNPLDCVDLLSTGRSLHDASARSVMVHAEVEPFAQMPKPQSPSVAAAMSAAAKEFAPASPKEAAKPKKIERAVLGEITNTIRDVDKKGSLLKSPLKVNLPSESLLGGGKLSNALLMPSSRNISGLKIYTDDSFEVFDDVAQPEKVSNAVLLPLMTKVASKLEALAARQDSAPLHVRPYAELTATSPPGAEVDSDEDDDDFDRTMPVGPLPSVGSAEHAFGNCKRCNFFAKGRCQNGEDCSFCHLSHEKKKASRQEKRERKAEWLARHDGSFSDKAFSPMAAASMSAFSFSGVAPPPGLGPDSFQPEEEVSPAATQGLGRPSPLLSTMPSTPTIHAI